jgi:uncharacterized protein (TIGR02147 family)
MKANVNHSAETQSKAKTPPQMAAVALPDIFLYTNYRQFMKDYYQARKQADPKFSLRILAALAQFPSHGLLKYLMEGKRNLSKKTLIRLSPAFGFTKDQGLFFENLVFFNQAKTLDEKTLFYEKILKATGASTFKRLEASQLQIFKKWHSVVLREMLHLKSFRNNPAWLASQLITRVDSQEVQESLDMLLTTGLIKKTANGFKTVDPDITTDDEIRSFLVKSYHAQMLKLAAWAQDEIPGKERDISSVCFTIKASEMPALKKQLQLMRKELRSFASPAGEGDRVVQVNIQLFPLTKAP